MDENSLITSDLPKLIRSGVVGKEIVRGKMQGDATTIGGSTLRKYTNKEQQFISINYGYDLERLVEYSVHANEQQKENIELIERFARELIDSYLSNLAEMFKVAGKVEDELIDEFNDLSEMEENGDLTREQSNRYNNLFDLLDQLRILNNLHPDRILTWEYVKAGFI